jgi:hypothetical protein
METQVEANPELFLFRGIYPGLSIGTASDRYAGWIGQIYTVDRYKTTSRTKKVGGRPFKEEVLPVESVEEYFLHFDILELDFTFYSFLLDDSGSPTRTYHTLRAYKDRLKQGDRLILKAPQVVFAQRFWRNRAFVSNPDYLNADLFAKCFYKPACDMLGDSLSGIVFEQEYQRKKEREKPRAFADKIDGFFNSIPEDHRYHIEVRTEAYLEAPFLDVIDKHGIGQVLSHWTWLPPLWKQYHKGGRRFYNRGKDCIVRLMTPHGVRYEEAYKQAFPFDGLVEGMMSPGMIEDAVLVSKEALREDVRINMIVNNRAGGNAPLIARRFAESFLRRIADET